MSGGRDIAPLINKLVDMPAFVIKVGTQDWHPQKHVSFASNHPSPNNKPFESYVDVQNYAGNKPHETMKQRLWPDHCVQGTEGAEIIREIDAAKFDLVVKKGMDERIEMYSAFTDSFGNLTAGLGGVNHDLAQVLRDKGVTHVYNVGIAGDYCVRDTALGAANAGFTSYLIEEAQKCVDAEAWQNAKDELMKTAVKVISMDSEEVKRLDSS